MAKFVGRERELRSLDRLLERVRNGAGGAAPGQCVLVRGRRRVGKSRLLEQFCENSKLPYIFFSASQQGEREVALFGDEVAQSGLPGHELFVDSVPGTWDAALRTLAAAVDEAGPTVVVIDEFPYLVKHDPSIEATFQKQWDRLLSKKPVLLVLIGSNLAMMEALSTYGRPFYQRGTEMIVGALSPVETAEIVGSPTAADAFDAYLITGGLPLVCDEWPTGLTMWKYLEGALNEPTSPLIVSAERVLAAEFPTEVQARAVLTQIGAGEATFTNIARAAGGMQQMSAKRSLDLLGQRQIVAKDLPYSTAKSKEARYRVADPYLRFWLRFVGASMPEIERGRGDRVYERIVRDWTTWRGKAIEPVIREALRRLSPVTGLPPADHIGGFWPRNNKPEIDIIAGDASPVARTLAYAGTIKWLDNKALTQADINKLIGDLLVVPGATAGLPLVAVSRGDVTATGVVKLGPEDLIAAW